MVTASAANRPRDGAWALTDRAARAQRAFEVPILIAALLVVPVIIIQERTVSSGWLLATAVADWLIWGAFFAEYLVVVSLTDRRWEYTKRAWLDLAIIITSFPLLPAGLAATRLARLIRLTRVLRLLRLFRLLAILVRAQRAARTLLETRGLGYLLIVMVLVVLGVGGLFALIEPEVPGLLDGIWWAVVTLTTVGYGDIFPTTGLGRVLGVALMLFGVGFLGVLAGSLAAFFIEEGKGMAEAKVSGHILICGWSSKGEEILRELHAEEVEDKRPVVILAPLESSPTRDKLVTFVRGNPSSEEDLRRAGVDRADTSIILADESDTAASDSDLDARTLLTALAVESLNASCYTCVEVIRAENRQHFERTGADELVVSAELTGSLLASSAIVHGLSGVVSDLLTHPTGDEFYPLPLPDNMVGKTFKEAIGKFKEEADCIPVAVRVGEDSYRINPPADLILKQGDKLLVISRGQPSIS